MCAARSVFRRGGLRNFQPTGCERRRCSRPTSLSCTKKLTLRADRARACNPIAGSGVWCAGSYARSGRQACQMGMAAACFRCGVNYRPRAKTAASPTSMVTRRSAFKVAARMVAASALWTPPARVADSVLKVGIGLPFTGSDAAAAPRIGHGGMVAFEDTNASHSVNGTTAIWQGEGRFRPVTHSDALMEPVSYALCLAQWQRRSGRLPQVSRATLRVAGCCSERSDVPAQPS